MVKSAEYFKIITLVTIALSCLLVGYSTWCGMGFTFDSYDYFAASRSWRLTKDLFNDNGSIYVFHAPLFPVILSAFSSQYFGGYVLLNLAVCCLSCLILYFSVRKYFEHPVLLQICFASIALSVGFQMIHHFLWTESIFLLLFIIHNFFLIRVLENAGRKDFWVLVFLAFLMGITKNTGFFIILSTSVVLLWQIRSKALRYTVLYSVLGSLGFALWNLSVLIYRQGATIYTESDFIQGFLNNGNNYADVISLWFFPAVIPFAYRLLIIGLIVMMFFYFNRKGSISKLAKSFLIQFTVYLAIMVIIIEVDKDEIERLLAIIAPWLALSIFMILDLYLVSFSKKIRVSVFILLFLFLSYTFIRSYKNVEMWHNRECSKEILSFYRYNAL